MKINLGAAFRELFKSVLMLFFKLHDSKFEMFYKDEVGRYADGWRYCSKGIHQERMKKGNNGNSL